MGAALEVPLTMPVLDGPQPAQWPIWGNTLEGVCNSFYASPRQVASAYDYLGRVRLKILLQSEEQLQARAEGQWSRIVGMLIDGSGTPETYPQVLDRVRRLCANIRGDEKALYRHVGRFHVAFLLPDESADNLTTTNFLDALEVDIARILALETRQVVSEPIVNSAVFRSILRSWERKLTRDWIANPPKAA